MSFNVIDQYNSFVENNFIKSNKLQIEILNKVNSIWKANKRNNLFSMNKKIDGVYVFTPSFGKDDRGIIYTSFYEDNFKEFLPKNLSFLFRINAPSRSPISVKI